MSYYVPTLFPYTLSFETGSQVAQAGLQLLILVLHLLSAGAQANPGHTGAHTHTHTMQASPPRLHIPPLHSTFLKDFSNIVDARTLHEHLHEHKA